MLETNYADHVNNIIKHSYCPFSIAHYQHMLKFLSEFKRKIDKSTKTHTENKY